MKNVEVSLYVKAAKIVQTNFGRFGNVYVPIFSHVNGYATIRLRWAVRIYFSVGKAATIQGFNKDFTFLKKGHRRFSKIKQNLTEGNKSWQV